MQTPLAAESARWGDQDELQALPYTVNAEWVSERDHVLANWLPARSAILLQQLRDADLYPDTVAPQYNQHGGAPLEDTINVVRC